MKEIFLLILLISVSFQDSAGGLLNCRRKNFHLFLKKILILGLFPAPLIPDFESTIISLILYLDSLKRINGSKIDVG